MTSKNYRISNWLSIFFIFMLFVIGGLVRSTGSGMGCPDWPKCFGQYIPPTSENTLPNNYQTFYKEQRIIKTNRFVEILKWIGLEKKALEIQKNSSLNETHEFNFLKAYVEYFNRIWGALTGIIVLICLILSAYYLKIKPKVFVFTLLGFIGVLFNALLGAVVVNSNLIGGIVTAHFIAAFASISFFLIANNVSDEKNHWSISNPTLSILLLIFTSIQVVIGAFVRESFDLITNFTDIQHTITFLLPKINYHAILGAVILGLAVLQFIRIPKHHFTSGFAKYILVLSALQLIIGPLSLINQFIAVSKLLHISFGAGLYVLQFYICTSFFKKNII